MSKKDVDVLSEFRRIEKRLTELNRQIRQESKIQAEELADRLRLGLTGDAAIKHYNDWMMLHGLTHLCVEE